MNPGRLRHRIQLQRRMTTRNTAGERSDNWLTYDTVSADVRPLLTAQRRREEGLEAGQVMTQIEIEVVMRYHPQVKAEDRAVFGDKLLDIVKIPINVGNRNAEMRLLCREVENG